MAIPPFFLVNNQNEEGSNYVDAINPHFVLVGSPNMWGLNQSIKRYHEKNTKKSDEIRLFHHV